MDLDTDDHGGRLSGCLSAGITATPNSMSIRITIEVIK